jgi:hypothetical protein
MRFTCWFTILVLLGSFVSLASADDPNVKPTSVPDRVTLMADRLAALPAELLKEDRTDDQLVDALVLATVMKLPAAQQRDNAKQYLQKHAKDRQRACEDIIWAYVNTKEFKHLHGLTDQEISDLNDRLNKK